MNERFEEFICPKCNILTKHKVISMKLFDAKHYYVYECLNCGNWTDQDIVDISKEGIKLSLPELCCEAVKVER